MNQAADTTSKIDADAMRQGIRAAADALEGVSLARLYHAALLAGGVGFGEGVDRVELKRRARVLAHGADPFRTQRCLCPFCGAEKSTTAMVSHLMRRHVAQLVAMPEKQ